MARWFATARKETMNSRLLGREMATASPFWMPRVARVCWKEEMRVLRVV